MNRNHIRKGIRTSFILITTGMICLVIAAISISTFSNHTGLAIATPFVWLWFFCSFPVGMLAAGQLVDSPPLGIVLAPLTLVVNAVLWGLVVIGFSKVKVIVNRRVYGDESSQQGDPD